jgi:large subunit ribosomal protein L29
MIQELTMKTSELRQKDVAGLETEVKELQKATQQLTNTAQMKVTRRAIARAKTILAQKAAAQE